MTTVRARYANGVLTPLEPLGLKEGTEVEVTLGRTTEDAAEEQEPSKPEAQSTRGTLAGMLDLVREMERTIPPEEWERLPTDLARNKKHYLYGHPKEEG